MRAQNASTVGNAQMRLNECSEARVVSRVLSLHSRHTSDPLIESLLIRHRLLSTDVYRCLCCLLFSNIVIITTNRKYRKNDCMIRSQPIEW